MAVQAAPIGERTEGMLLIPRRERVHGPVTASRLRRALAGYLVVVAAGLVPLLAGAAPTWKAFGLGLMAPGGGFLYTSDPVFVVLTLVLFALTLGLWFGAGNIVFPVVVWVGAAGLATLRVHTGIWAWAEIAVPALVLGLVLISPLAQRLTFRAAVRRGEERNRYLAERRYAPPLPSSGVADELSPDDLAHGRFLLDLALQPVDRFDGFDWVDQFQTAAVRYQLNFASYALALMHFTRMPAFTGYLAQAQRNLIDKMTDKRVWRYWRLENMWGNLDLNPDPIPRDNIMLSAYLAVMLAGYETCTADDRYDTPRSLVFRWNDKREFAYDHHAIAGAVYDNFKRSPWGMFPCEPNWIYSACNTFGINTLLSHDRLHGTSYASELIDSFKHAVDVEFLTPDGRVTAIRSSRLGLTIPSLTSTMADAGTALFLNPSLPAAAQRSWEIVRTEFVSVDDRGVPAITLRGWDKLDVGNYKVGTDVSASAMLMAAAVEMGDDEIYRAIANTLDDKFTPVVDDGVLRYEKASTQANCMLAMSRFGRHNGFHDLIARGLPTSELAGPKLVQAPYPDALVAKASTDGTALDLVLRAGAGPKRVPLVLGQLVPGRQYAVTGATVSEFRADDSGSARLEVDLAERTVVRIVPV